MPGSPKKKIERLRASGQHEMADWIERKEEARAEGVPLWKWLEDNPKPGDPPPPTKEEKLNNKIDCLVDVKKKLIKT